MTLSCGDVYRIIPQLLDALAAPQVETETPQVEDGTR